MDLGFLVQFAVEGSVAEDSGIARKVVNSFVYGLPDRDLSFSTKAHLGANFHGQVWTGIAQQLHASFQGAHLWVSYPNTAGDAPQDVLVPASGGSGGGRLALHQCVYAALLAKARTRPFRGCKHLGPVASSQVTAEELTPEAQAAWQSALGAVPQALVQFEAHEAIILQPVVWSRVLSDVSLTVPPAVGDVITGVHVNRTLGQWRHRRERTVL